MYCVILTSLVVRAVMSLLEGRLSSAVVVADIDCNFKVLRLSVSLQLATVSEEHTHTHTHAHTHNRFTARLEYVRVHLGEQVPER